MRIAFFGGSFDPPHRGHLAIAKAAADQFHLDQVLFAPAGLQPLKGDVRYTPYEDRLAMVELTCQQDARFLVSRLDAPRADGQPNYTVDTLAVLRHSLAPDDRLFCLVGADSFHDLPRWRDPQRLLTLCDWIVVSRPGYALPALPAQSSQQVHLLDGVYEDVSATAIRDALKHGFADAPLLPAVADYIRQHHLYE